MDVYMPLLDDHAVDAISKRTSGTIAQVQIKVRSRECLDSGLERSDPPMEGIPFPAPYYS